LTIDRRTLTKMKFVLNKEGVWVPKYQVKAHAEENHDKKEEKHINGDDEFVDVFATSPTTSSFKYFGTSSWQPRMEGHLEHIECEMHHI